MSKLLASSLPIAFPIASATGGLLVLLLGTISVPGHPKPGAQTKTVECPVYTVGRIEVVGNEFARHREVAKRIAFREGKPFLEIDAKCTIHLLNRWAHFEKVNRESIVVTYHAYDEARPDLQCFVDILVSLKEKRRK